MARVMHAASPIGGAPHVFIATPSTHICGNYSFAIAQAIPKVLMEDVAADYCLLMDNCHVDDANDEHCLNTLRIWSKGETRKVETIEGSRKYAISFKGKT